MHCTSSALLRALFSAGSNMLISNAMIPMTTSNSTRVNPRATRWGRQPDFIRHTPVELPTHRRGTEVVNWRKYSSEKACTPVEFATKKLEFASRVGRSVIYCKHCGRGCNQ